MSSPPFAVGDLVVQYRYFTTEGFVEGQRADQTGAVWQVLEIGPAFVLMELASGRYLSEYDDAPWKDPSAGRPATCTGSASPTRPRIGRRSRSTAASSPPRADGHSHGLS